MKSIAHLFLVIALLLFANTANAQSKAHASVGMGHGEEGYLHLEEMIKHLEFSLKMADATPESKKHLQAAVKSAKQALKDYEDALKHVSEVLGRPVGKGPMSEGSEGEDEGSGMNHHEEGSR